MLAVINGTPKKPRFTNDELANKYFSMAKKAFGDIGVTENITNRWALRKFAYCQARFLALTSIEYKDEPHTLDDYRFMFKGISIFVDMLSLMTPAELLQTFPVTKTYNGAKYQCKDYFSSMDSLKGLDMNKQFNKQGVNMMKTLCDYQNTWIDDIVVSSMLLVDRIRIAEGKDDLFTAFCKAQGKEPPRTLKMCKSPDGKQYMMDENGKTLKVHKPKPRYLRLVSKGRLHDCVDKKGGR